MTTRSPPVGIAIIDISTSAPGTTRSATIVVRTGGILCPVGAIDLVHGREVARVLDVDVNRRDVGQARAGLRQRLADGRRAPVCVCALMSPSGRERAGDVDESVGFDGGAERKIGQDLERFDVLVQSHGRVDRETWQRPRQIAQYQTSHESPPTSGRASVQPGRGHSTTVDATLLLIDGMPRPVILPEIQRRKSKLHGFGVFALEPINKNKRIIDYAGELITQQTEREPRGSVSAERLHLGLPRQSRLEPRRERRRQRRALHQPLVRAELLGRRRRQDHLDPRGAEHRARRRADLRLQHRGRQDDPVPLPPGVQDEAVTRLVVPRSCVLVLARFWLGAVAQSCSSQRRAWHAGAAPAYFFVRSTIRRSA